MKFANTRMRLQVGSLSRPSRAAAEILCVKHLQL